MVHTQKAAVNRGTGTGSGPSVRCFVVVVVV